MANHEDNTHEVEVSPNQVPHTGSVGAVSERLMFGLLWSRYIYDLYYKRDAISKELYNWLLKEGYADAK